MAGRPVLAVLAAIAVLFVLWPAGASASPRKHCESFRVNHARAAHIKTWIVSCAKARKVIRTFFRRNAPSRVLGFRCEVLTPLSSGAVVCNRGEAVVRWRLVAAGARKGIQVVAARSCGSFTLRRYRYRVSIEKGHVRCRRARSVLRNFLAGKGERHEGRDQAHTYVIIGRWRCGYGAGGGGCIRHGRTYRTARDYILAQS
jgi:hypothetical protein